MNIRACIDFWGDGVTCFCHEAVGRALHEAFPGLEIDPIDVAYENYEKLAEFEKIERSVWFGYLRNGPGHRFRLPSGVTGTLSRYSLRFHLPDDLAPSHRDAVREFLHRLQPREIMIEEWQGPAANAENAPKDEFPD